MRGLSGSEPPLRMTCRGNIALPAPSGAPRTGARPQPTKSVVQKRGDTKFPTPCHTKSVPLSCPIFGRLFVMPRLAYADVADEAGLATATDRASIADTSLVVHRLVLGRPKPAMGQGDRDAGSDGPPLVEERRGTGRYPVATVMGVRRKHERARLWPRLVDAYSDFDSYQEMTEREIPVIILQPR
jgi:hypothetical protein